MRKQCILALLVVGLMYTVTAGAVAQNSGNNDQQAAEPGAPAEHSRRHFDPAERTERLTKQLKLTADQQPKVLEILKAEQSQMESLRSDSSASQDDRRSKMMDIHKASNDQIRALLDSDQQKKFDAMQSKREQWQGHHHDGQGQGAPPDSTPPK
jgi:predicted transglutaminase-like cysteine proteinase